MGRILARALQSTLPTDRQCRKLRLGVHTVRARNRNGLDVIAAGLRRDGVRVL